MRDTHRDRLQNGMQRYLIQRERDIERGERERERKSTLKSVTHYPPTHTCVRLGIKAYNLFKAIIAIKWPPLSIHVDNTLGDIKAVSVCKYLACIRGIGA